MEVPGSTSQSAVAIASPASIRRQSLDAVHSSAIHAASTGSSGENGNQSDSTSSVVAQPTSEAQPANTTPLWWPASRTRHDRSISNTSEISVRYDSQGRRTEPIQLRDRSDEDNEMNVGCWARSVTIDGHVVVGEVKGVGAYIVWHCTVHTLSGGDLNLRKRYSEFDQLRNDLVRAFPHAANMIPPLPRKSVVSRFRPRFLDQRQAGLSHFLNCVLLNSEFAASPILKDFVFT